MRKEPQCGWGWGDIAPNQVFNRSKIDHAPENSRNQDGDNDEIEDDLSTNQEYMENDMAETSDDTDSNNDTDANENNNNQILDWIDTRAPKIILEDCQKI